MKQKLKYLLVLIVAFGALLVLSGKIFTSYQDHKSQKENEKYFVNITAKNVTTKGMDLQIECLDNIQIGNREIDVDYYYLEKWNLTGWKAAEYISGEFFNYRGPEADAVSPKYNSESEIEWATHYGELPSGVYRVKMPVIEAQALDSEQKNAVGECSVPFLVIDWWNFILFFVALEMLCLILCYRKEVATYIRVHKKKLLRTGIVTLLLGVFWSVFLFYDGERANKKFELNVSLENLTPKDATIVIECSDKIVNEELSVWIGGYRIEKWTPIGWREMQFLSGDAFYGRDLSACSIYPGNVYEQYIKWTGHYGVLGNGLYRIAMSIGGEYDVKEKTSETLGNCYATFVILKGRYSDLENFEPDKGPHNSEELAELQLKLEGTMCIEDKYPDYYAGCYTEKGNLIILLTTQSNKVKREIKEALGQEEGIIFRHVKYSLNELKEVQKKIGEIYNKYYEEGDEEKIQLLSNLSSAGVREKENKVVVALRDMSDETVKAFKKLFQNGGKIRYEYGNVVDTGE